MKVSFIVPIYKKTPEQLRNCLKSLTKQSYKDIEVIAVFDGENEELQKAALDFHVKSIVIEHGGACKARNEGAKLSTGDLIVCWDADCYAEPEMTRMWVDTLNENPDCDFVYSGYRFTDPNYPAFESEPFDPWTLEKYNYIASMFPLRREKFPGWDESLDGLQDWDYWRRVVAAGSKGKFIPGYGFVTEPPTNDSISGQTEKRIERIRRVREKHKDVTPDILVQGILLKRDAIVMAKTLGADYFNGPFWKIGDYKMVLMMGLHPWEIENSVSTFMAVGPDTVRAIYWTGYDADSFAMSPYMPTKALIKTINEGVHYNFAMDDRTKNVLDAFGIQSEVLAFPREAGEPGKALPDKFKVLVWADDNFRAHAESVVKAMPDIEFQMVQENIFYRIPEYALVMQYTASQRLEMGSKNALMMGRYVISNVQAPYAGYISPNQDVTAFKNEVIAKIREIQAKKEINAEAQAHYLEETAPGKFVDRIKACLPAKLEVVA